MVTVGMSSNNPKVISMIINGVIHFTHFSYGIFATPKTPISTPDVGVIIFVNPSPNWNAITVDWRDNPIRSENGAIIGMVKAAFAEPDGITTLMTV